MAAEIAPRTLHLFRSGNASPHFETDYGNLPLSFEPNLGQTDPRVRFLTRTGGVTVFLTDSEAVMSLRGGAVIRMKLARPQAPASVRGSERLPGTTNYFLGSDPKQWRTDVPNYAQVRYEAVYPGVDLVYHGNQRQLEYDFVLAPGTKPDVVELAYEGVDSVGVAPDGSLLLATAAGVVKQLKPSIYQIEGGRRVEVAGGYRVHGKRVGFTLARYDEARPLVIDPVLVYSTFLGGSSYDQSYAIAVDSTGAAYVTGYTQSANFPTQAPYQSARKGTQDVFVAKLAPAGNTLVYSTYLGGSSSEAAAGIAVDKTGAAYVTGWTTSTDFPLVGAYQKKLAGLEDVFVTKLSPAGNALTYSTYLGGIADDFGGAIAVDSAGSAYVAGWTNSFEFPTLTPYQTFKLGYDAFVTKLTPSGSGLVYSTYLGGTEDDFANAIAVDSTGAAYVAGGTYSIDFPLHSPFQGTLKGLENVFVTKLAPAGTSLLYSTYLGGSTTDAAQGIAIDSAGSAYLTGYTNSADFPTQSPYQTYTRAYDAFVSKLTPAGNGLAYSTYLGGANDDYGNAIAVDSTGAAYVTGRTYSPDFPSASPYQAFLGVENAFVTELGPTGNTLAYSTFLGGSGNDEAYGIALDGTGAAYVTGITSSSDFPVVLPAYQSTLKGSYNAFVTKLIAPLVTITTVPAGLPIAVDGGAAVNAPQSFNWTAGSTHSISVNSPQPGGGGTRYAFGTWSDGGAQTHTITVPTTPTTYTATFTTQFLLTTSVVPTGAGTVTASPATTDGYYASGASVQLTATANPGYSFTGWTQNLTPGSTQPTLNLTMSGSWSVVANFTAVAGITVTTNPGGLSMVIDGATLTAPQSFQWSAGSQHSISVTSPQGANGTRYTFSGWSDGGAQTHTITAPSTATTYTANFTTQYLLTTQASPTAGGSITASPSSTDGYYASGTSVQLTANASSGYQFTGWSGDLTATTSPQSVTMSAPHNVTASFGALAGITIATNPPGLSIVVDTSTLTAPQVFNWTPGSQHSIGVTSPQGSRGTRCIFANWSDGGAQTHNITTPASASAYTANFTLQYLLTMQASPAAGGSIAANPTSTDGYYNSPAGVQLTPVAANCEYQFTGWSGDLAGTANPASLTMSATHTVTAGFNQYRTFSDNGFFVCQQYLDLLGRAPDTSGYNYWLGLLNGGQVTRGQVADAYFVSPEFQGDGFFIISAYIAVLGRNPDYAGWLYWLNNLWAGTTQQQVINSFIQSTEFQTTYGALNNTQFVTLVYQNVLGRAPDQAGLSYWVGQLNSGAATPAQCMYSFATSAEFQSQIQNQGLATLLYMGFLRRSPDPAGVTYWTGQLNAGIPAANVLNAFITSAEYMARF